MRPWPAEDGAGGAARRPGVAPALAGALDPREPVRHRTCRDGGQDNDEPLRQAPSRSLRPTGGCRVDEPAGPRDQSQGTPPKRTPARAFESDPARTPTRPTTHRDTPGGTPHTLVARIERAEGGDISLIKISQTDRLRGPQLRPLQDPRDALRRPTQKGPRDRHTPMSSAEPALCAAHDAFGYRLRLLHELAEKVLGLYPDPVCAS
jgi:hypothetical protein